MSENLRLAHQNGEEEQEEDNNSYLRGHIHSHGRVPLLERAVRQGREQL